MIGKISGYINKDDLKNKNKNDDAYTKYYEEITDLKDYSGEQFEIVHDTQNKTITIMVSGIEIEVPESIVRERWTNNERIN